MWIWYPGDFEIWLGNKFNNRRTERGAMFPPFWRQFAHDVTVEFSTQVDLAEPETISIWCEGQFNFMLDGKLQFGQPKQFLVPAGQHSLNFKVHNLATPPALLVEGKTIHTGSHWMATFEDKIWIDENGVAHGSGIYVPAGCWTFSTPDDRPSAFQLAREDRQAVSTRQMAPGRMLYDFGRETMGYIVLHGISGKGIVEIYYGESEAEALDTERCETLDRFEVEESLADDFHYIVPESKAFRYALIVNSPSLAIDTVSMQYEFLPHDLSRSGRFECSDDEVNRIWQVGAYTMDLTTREFMMDGIKRDRWTWSGDAIQSYLMNYYLRFDSDTVKRTIRQLRGKDPVTSHINTILDYTFYWFKSVYDYYQFTADAAFVREIYPRMLTMMDYVLGRLDADGFATGQADDWVFVDWVDFPMHKRGALCFEQLLLAKSLQTMHLCSEIVGPLSALQMSNLHLKHLAADGRSLPDYGAMAASLLYKTDQTFWNEAAHGYMHALEPDGQGGQWLNPQITKFPNMFAMIFGYATPERQQQIMQHVMLNPAVDPITTPYMRFYELEAMCRMGRQTEVMGEIKSYWGGMLREGATSFWEKYNPEMTGNQHLEMYGRPYGKSLCHAWGASPVYLLGRYYLGVEPVAPGYGQATADSAEPAWTARPTLGGLEWMRGDVPTPHGLIHLEMDAEGVTVSAPQGIGTGRLYVGDHSIDVRAGQTVSLIIKE